MDPVASSIQDPSIAASTMISGQAITISTLPSIKVNNEGSKTLKFGSAISIGASVSNSTGVKSPTKPTASKQISNITVPSGTVVPFTKSVPTQDKAIIPGVNPKELLSRPSRPKFSIVILEMTV